MIGALLGFVISMSASANSICYPVGSSDGQMATVVCVPAPVSPAKPSFESSYGDFGSRGVYGGSNHSTFSPQYSPSTSSPVSTPSIGQPSVGSTPSSSPNLPLNNPHLEVPRPYIPDFTPTWKPQSAPSLPFQLPSSAQTAIDIGNGVMAWLAGIGETIAIEMNKANKELLKKIENENKINEAAQKTLKAQRDELKKLENEHDLQNQNLLDEQGIIRGEFVERPEMRVLRDKITLQSSKFTDMGRQIRKTLNRALSALAPSSPTEAIETMNMSISFTLGADLAFADGDLVSADRLLKNGLVVLDLGLGLLPIVGAVNDALQIGFGMFTGNDYTGQRMAAGDYALRAAGVVLWAVPVVGAIRLGKFVFNRQMLKIAQAARAAAKVIPKLGDKYVRVLPDLSGTFKEAFEGHIFKGVGEPGDVLFQSQRTGQTKPGRWFGPVKPLDPSHADDLYFLRYTGNTGEQLKAYRIKERISGYAGKVRSGEGHQFYIPDDVPLEDVLEEIAF